MLDILETMKVDMELKGYSPRTVKAYLAYARKFAGSQQKSLEQVQTEEIRNYLHHLIVNKKFSSSYINVNYSALKFLYKNTLKQHWDIDKLPRLKKDKKLPVVLSKTEVKKFFSRIDNLKYRSIFSTIYSAGLRISEVRNLKISDIDSSNMQIRIRMAKGKKDRYTILSINNLHVLRSYFKKHKPKGKWLFPGRYPDKPLCERSIQSKFTETLDKAGITKNATVHTLRHCFATHLYESGVDIFHIQKLLGHATPKTTTIYIHLARLDILDVKSPFDSLNDSDDND